MAHTPGPWNVSSGKFSVSVLAEKPVCVIPTSPFFAEDISQERKQAIDNALLIAAAPDLLAALEACRDALRSETVADHALGIFAASAYRAAKAAIAKARGG